MKFLQMAAVCAVAVSLSACAASYSVAPVPSSAQQVRYSHGAPTVYSELKMGAVQVTPLGVNQDNRLGFAIAVFNKSGGPSNFGVENVSLADANGSAVKVFTSEELIHEAKVKAGWAEFATILAGGLAAYAAQSNAYSTTNGSVSGSFGTVNYSSRTYDPALAYAGTAAAGATTGYGLTRIEDSLDRTVADINGRVLQTTTIDPGNSIGGLALADSLPSRNFPQDFMLHVNWNGEDHAFRFLVSEGTAAPVQTAATLPQWASAAPQTVPASSATARDWAPQPVSGTAVRYDQWSRGAK